MDFAALSRRRLIVKGLPALILGLSLRPAHAAPPPRTLAAMREFAGGVAPMNGRVLLDIPPLVENGNSVPLTVSVESPMTETDHVVEIALFSERNPLPDIARFRLGPRCGQAWVMTRIRLGDTQTIHALARMSDGSVRAASAELLVTLPACIEG
jgi:sulfur-oxidizing protein SoxY